MAPAQERVSPRPHAPYALVEARDPEAIDIFLCETDAQRALEDCLRDEPQWRSLLPVEEIELSEASLSPN